MKNYSEISNRYIKENKKRTILTILGVAMATVLIFAIGTFLLSFRDAMIKEKRNKSDFEFRISDLNNEQAKNIINNVEVKDASVHTSNPEDIFLIKGTERTALISKGSIGYYQKIKHEKVVEGEVPKHSNEIVIDNNAKKFLKVEVGDKLTLVSEEGEKDYKIVGITENGAYSYDKVVK